MKSIYILVLLELVLLLRPFNVEASLIRFENNPVIESSEWYDINAVYSSSTVLHNDKYYLFYSGYFGGQYSINLAVSLDGIHWTKESNNPILLTNTSNSFICEKGIHDPDVIFDDSDNKFKMWYVADCDPNTTGIPRYWIKYAESSDGISWTVRDNPVLSPTNSWEIEGVTWPTVIRHLDKYQMWFAGRNSQGLWQIGYAESSDGISWIKRITPVLSPTESWEASAIGGPDIIYDGNQYVLYYHNSIIYATSSDGITWTKPLDNPILLKQPNETLMWSPDAVVTKNNLFIYYSVLINGKWSIYLASTSPIVFSPSSSKIILLPGLFGSWNRDAILHNKPAGVYDWQLNLIVHDYDGIINSLKNIGQVENQDFFVFPYDWRKSVGSSSADLNTFITDKISDTNTKVNLVGHSLGGLVSRVYGQKNDSAIIDKLITVGSPHSGAALTYKAVEGGEIDGSSPLDWLGKKSILMMYKNKFESDRNTLASIVPSLLDLLPTYDYLKNKDNSFVPYAGMQIKNNTMINLNPTFSNLFNQLHTIYGEKEDTIFGYKINTRSLKDKLLGDYPDGRPQQTLYDIGDSVILSNSARAGNNQYPLSNLDHGEIIRTKTGIKQIFDILGLNYSDEQIVEGQESKIKPSSLYLLLSSAKKHLSVRHNSKLYIDTEGALLIPDAKSGHYQLEINGNEPDEYTLSLLQNAGDQDYWETITSAFNQTFEFDFDSQKIKPFLLTQENPAAIFDDILSELSKLSKENPDAVNIYKKALDAKKTFQKNNQIQLKSQLDQIHQMLFNLIKKQPTNQYNRYFELITKFENLYQSVLTKSVNSLCGINSCLFNLIKVKKMFTNCEASKKSALFCQEAEEKMNLLTKIDTKKSPLLIQIMNRSIEQLLKLAGSKI